MMCLESGVIKSLYVLEGLPPKIWEDEKNVQNLARFLTTFNFDREYPKTAQSIANPKSIGSTTAPSTLDNKNWVNFGPQTKEL